MDAMSCVVGANQMRPRVCTSPQTVVRTYARDDACCVMFSFVICSAAHASFPLKGERVNPSELLLAALLPAALGNALLLAASALPAAPATPVLPTTSSQHSHHNTGCKRHSACAPKRGPRAYRRPPASSKRKAHVLVHATQAHPPSRLPCAPAAAAALQAIHGWSRHAPGCKQWCPSQRGCAQRMLIQVASLTMCARPRAHVCVRVRALASAHTFVCAVVSTRICMSGCTWLRAWACK